MTKKILVVDDEIEIVELMEGWLTHLGYEVISAGRGDDALWKAKSEKPDLIIIDALIPQKTGYQVIQDLKKQTDSVRDIPIIMISGRESMRDTSGDVFAFIGKPFEPKELLSVIRKALKETGPKGENP